MFYDNFVQLCKKHGVSPSKAAVDAGLSKSTVTKWKTTPDAQPTGTAIKKLSEYFCVPISELLNEEEQNNNSPDEFVLNEGEKKLLELFRLIPEEQQPVVLSMIRAALGRK